MDFLYAMFMLMEKVIHWHLLKNLELLVVSLVVVYGIVQAALGVAEAGRGMGNHDSSQMSSGLWRMGGGILMSAVGAVLAYLGLQ